MPVERAKNLEDPDACLKVALKYLRREWNDIETGFVACVIEDGGKYVVATNKFTKEGNVIHAENRAISMFTEEFGEPTLLTKAVVTLSPCVEYSPYRVGDSCASILIKHGIRNIHFGLLHEKQGNMETYQNLGFSTTESFDQDIKDICIKLLNFYIANKKSTFNNNEEWNDLKRDSEKLIFNSL